MKRIYLFLKQFICDPIIGHKRGFYLVSPAAAADVPDAPLSHLFKFAKPVPVFEIEYDQVYDHAMESLRQDGWTVQLKADVTGELCYAVYMNTVVISTMVSGSKHNLISVQPKS